MFRPSKILAMVMLWSCAQAAPLPAEWQFQQVFEVRAPGLIKIELPRETLGKARPALEDLRLFTESGTEVPYSIIRTRAASESVLPAKSFQSSLNASQTVLIVETGIATPIKALTLETPGMSFIKGVRVEGSNDRSRWDSIVQGVPIFRQPNGSSQLEIAIPQGSWRWLRATIDDRRSQPVPFTGARLHARGSPPAAVETFAATISQRDENPGESRLTVKLGAANLDIAALLVETSEPLFTRKVRVATTALVQESLTEQSIAQGTIFRVAVDGQPVSGLLRVPVERRIGAAELVLLIDNGDSAPLPISAVRVERRPVYMVFHAREPGTYQLLTGNRLSQPPRYDLTGLSENLTAIDVSPIRLPPPETNPNFRAPEVLSGIAQEGPSVDLSEWKYRKPLHLAQRGAQVIELDLDILSHAQPSFADLRLIRDGKQVPYVLERTSIARAVAPSVTVTNAPKDRTVSQWVLRLPRARLPITRLSCTSQTPLFQRDITFFEELEDDRGATYRRHLGAVTWTQTPDRRTRELVHFIPSTLTGETLVVETANGDNLPIQLGDFRLYYTATRLHFKGDTADGLHLYYGNANAAPPRYDIALVGGQLLAAEHANAELGNQQQLKKTTWAEGRRPGTAGVIFWAVLGLVVVVLLGVIARLLPKPPAA